MARSFSVGKIESYYEAVTKERKRILLRIKDVKGIGPVRHDIISHEFNIKSKARDYHVPLVTQLVNRDMITSYITNQAIRNERRRFVTAMNQHKFITEKMSEDIMKHIFVEENTSNDNEKRGTDVSTFRSSKYRIG